MTGAVQHAPHQTRSRRPWVDRWRTTPMALAWCVCVVVALVGIVAAQQRPRDLTLPVTSAAFDHAATNWNPGERAAGGSAFRWTGDVSTLTFRAARRVLPANRPVTLVLTFAPRPAGSPASTVTLLVNGQRADTWPSNVGHPVAIDVAALLKRDDALTVTIETDTFTPRGDPRALGVLLVGDPRLVASRGLALPSPDAAVSVIVLVLLSPLAVGRPAAPRTRLIAAGAMAVLCVLGVLAARLTFWRLAMPLELVLGAIVVGRWAPVWWRALSWSVAAVQRRYGIDARVLMLGGGVAAVAGQAAIALHRWTPAGVVVLVVGLVVVAWGCVSAPPVGGPRDAVTASTVNSVDAPSGDRLRIGRWQLVALVGIAALAVALRCVLLTEMPASLFRDEARHALRAIRILDDPTYRPVYEPEIALPALFLYPLALWFKILGISLLTLRLFMALVGVADVVLLFLLGRRLFGTRVGLIAAYLFSVSFWALRMQRVALAPCFSTGLVLLALWLFVRAMQSRRWQDWALAGIGAAGTVYCYHSGPFALVLMAGVALALLIRSPRSFARSWLPRFALFAALFLILAAPLLRYVAIHFDQYMARPRQTAIFSEVNLRRLGQDRLAAFEANITPNLGMYTVRGDFEPKHNLPHAPHLDAVMAVLFLLGVALALSGRLTRAPYGLPRFGVWFVLGYLGAMLIPSILAIDAPNTLRAFDTLPPALLLTALGIDAIWARLARANPGAAVRPQARFAIGTVTVLLVAVFALNGGIYFWRMRTDGRETVRFDTYFASQVGKRIVAETATEPGMIFFIPRAAMDRDVFPLFARIADGNARLQLLEDAAAPLPAHYAILLPNGANDQPDRTIAALPWARGLTRLPGNSPAGAGGVPAFVEFRTP